MHQIFGNLLDEFIAAQTPEDVAPTHGEVIFISDCVDTSGSFVLYHLVKRALSEDHSNVVFIASAHPFSHYDRIFRKLGCNLVTEINNKRFHFLELNTLQHPYMQEDGEGALSSTFAEILNAINVHTNGERSHINIVIDDLSLMEVAARGSSHNVLNFLHYCHSLTSEIGGTLCVLNHEDIYSSEEDRVLLQLMYLSDVIVKVEPLATGLAPDVHGQMAILNKKVGAGVNNVRRLHFRVKENGAEYFYPGYHN